MSVQFATTQDERNKKIRCTWAKEKNPTYIAYHDEEWGVPIHDDRKYFEMLILEGAQAGLSWETILMKRAGYHQAFYGFDPQRCATLRDSDLEELRSFTGIVRNRLKIMSVRKNAQAFLTIQKEYGSFDAFVRELIGGKQIVNRLKRLEDSPTTSPEAERLSKDLKKRGMSFVGPTIMYSYLQSVGRVNDHLVDCFRYKACMENS